MCINKWHTFTACCLLQLLMGVQYCFSCAPQLENPVPQAAAAYVMITQTSDTPETYCVLQCAHAEADDGLTEVDRMSAGYMPAT